MAKIAEVHNSLWTPDGEKTLHEKGVVPLTPREVQMFAAIHELAYKYNLSVVCRSCDHSITGQNNDSSKVVAIACQCREFRYVR